MTTLPRPAVLAPPSSLPPARRLVAPVLGPALRPAGPRAVGPRPPAAPRAGDEPVERAAHALAHALVEVVSGRRPPAQLDGLLVPDAVAVCEQAAGTMPGLRVRSIRVQRPAPDAAEAAVHLADGPHSRAAALRLRRSGGRWHCVRLEIALTSGEVTRAGSSSASGGWPGGEPGPAPGARDGS